MRPCTHAPTQEPFNRIKKEMLKEVKGMGPGERVLLLGNSREPWICTKKDEKVGGVSMPGRAGTSSEEAKNMVGIGNSREP